jgi:hypothetical protein
MKIIVVSLTADDNRRGDSLQSTAGLYSDDRLVANADPMKEDFVYGRDQTFLRRHPAEQRQPPGMELCFLFRS